MSNFNYFKLIISFLTAGAGFSISLFVEILMRSSRKWNTNKFYSNKIQKKSTINVKIIAILLLVDVCILLSIIIVFYKGLPLNLL